MKIWKKNLVVAAILLTVCGGIYVNWMYGQDQAVVNLTDTLDENKILSADKLVMADDITDTKNFQASECLILSFYVFFRFI